MQKSSKRGWLAVTVALGAAGMLMPACSSGSDPTTTTISDDTTTTIDRTDDPTSQSDQGRASQIVESDPDFRIGEVTGPYQVVYRLADLSDPEVEPSTDVLTVVPPYTSRLETLAEAPPGGQVIALQIASRDSLRVGNPDEPLVVARVPRPGPSDLRVASVLDAGVETGRLELAEQRLVADRRCQVIRSATLLGSGPLQPVGEDEFADTCVDADGVVLEEVLHLDGQPTLYRVAVEVDLDPDLDGVDLEAGEPTAPVDQGGGATLVAEPDSAPEGDFWVLPAPPDGFAHTVRLSVIPPQSDRFAEPEGPGVIAPTVDLYERGIDVIVVSQGSSRGGIDVFEQDPRSETVGVEPLGTGELLLDANGSELRFDLGGGDFLHLTGTVEPSVLVELASTMQLTQGAGLVFVDGG